MNPRTWKGGAALLCALAMAGCGGSGSGGSSAGTLRFVNATQDYGAVDLYLNDVEQLAGVGESSASSYLSFDVATYTAKLKHAGSTVTSATQSVNMAADGVYTLVAFNVGTTLSTAIFTDDKAAPTSGYAAMRFYNTGVAAGPVDVYVIDPAADISAAAPTATLSAPAMGSYAEIPAGTYRIRVTGAGDKTDVRLDVPSVALADQQIATMMLTTASGGVLLNGMLVNQAGAVVPYRNANARLRVVAAVTANGGVSAATSDGSLGVTLQSPTVGGYASVPAALTGLLVKVNGTAVDTSTLVVTAGSDNTLLVYGDAAAPQWRLLVDDNVPASVSTNAKLRLVHLLSGLGSTASLSADYVSVADDVAYGSASTSGPVGGASGMRLEVTSPVRASPLYLATDVTLAAQKVYSLFLVGDAAAPVAVLRKDR
ncbi:MAG: DUF4397 domain-containing protein [Rhizobacter sp.]